MNTTITPKAGTLSVTGAAPNIQLETTTNTAQTLSYPLRPDFLAQVVVPRDLKEDEAKRLNRFILTLSQDYNPDGF